MDSVDFVTKAADRLTGGNAETTYVEDDIGVIITIKVTGGISSLIGRGGVTLAAMGVIAKALGYNDQHRVKILIDER